MILIHLGDDVLGEIEHPHQIAGRDVQQQAQTAGHAFDIPDMADRRGQLDVAHALAAHPGRRHLHTALLADDALVANPLVFAAVALIVFGGTKDALAEQAVPLGPQRAVVDGFGLQNLTVGPLEDLFGRGQANANGIKVIDFQGKNLLVEAKNNRLTKSIQNSGKGDWER